MGWFDPRGAGALWAEAERVLGRRPEMAALIRQVGPCTLKPRRDHFVVLLRSLFSQQIATSTAHTLFERFRDLFPGRRPTPERVHEVLNGAVDVGTLKRCGLSRQKREYVRSLAQHYLEKKIDARRLRRADDEPCIQMLMQVRGIGVWTAQMFLLFALNRTDIWPVLDLGLQKGVMRSFDWKEKPRPRDLEPIGERYRPYRSIATWYFWRGSAR